MLLNVSDDFVLITKQDEACDIFYFFFFVNVAKNIGNNHMKVDNDHPRISAIKGNYPDLADNSFSFSPFD